MARTAIIRVGTGIVGNVLELTEPWMSPGWITVASLTAKIGDLWDGGTGFTPVTPAVTLPELTIGFVTIDADVSTTLASFVDTGLSAPIPPARLFAFEAGIFWTSTVTTTGLGLAIAGPVSPVAVAGVTMIPNGAGTATIGSFGAYNVGTPSTGIDVINAVRYARLWGTLRTGGAGGPLHVRFRSEIATTSVTVKADSWLTVTRIGF
jgi:hypothetical protein